MGYRMPNLDGTADEGQRPVARGTEPRLRALDGAATDAFIAKAIALAPKYRTGLLLDEQKPWTGRDEMSSRIIRWLNG
jgi:hypothetical protein